MRKTYDPFAQFYDLEYGHKDDDIPFYADMANKYGSPVLEIGIGTGRIALPLAEAGHQVWGIDDSPKMLRIAQKKLMHSFDDIRKNVRLIAADMRAFSLRQYFPLCVIPFRAFLHNLTLSDQISTLQCIYRHLLPGGILAFDLFVPLHSVLAREQWQDEIGTDELAIIDSGVSIATQVHHDPAIQMLHIENTYHRSDRKGNRRSSKSKMHYRYVFRFEMELLLKVAGFDLLHVYGGFEKQDYDFYSGLMIFIAQKPCR